VGVAEILQHVDYEIAQLQRARALLNGGASKTSKASGNGVARKRRKSNLSPAGRKRIVEAVKRRWEKQKKAAASK
jgi:hypothetical protein